VDDVDALVDSARHGDATAFGALFDEFHPRVFRFLLAKVGDRHAAEDMAAEVFVEVAERLHRFTGDGASFRGWIFTIARHDLADRWRAASRRVVEPVAELPEDSGAPDEVELAVEHRLDVASVAACLTVLTEDQRDVILLRFASGLSLVETGEVLGKPLTAVKSLQHRGLAALRRAMAAEGGPR
jgi:RNA polymerase sigma-70 factor (ECF subfamily)